MLLLVDRRNNKIYGLSYLKMKTYIINGLISQFK